MEDGRRETEDGRPNHLKPKTQNLPLKNLIPNTQNNQLMKIKINLLLKIVIAIILGIVFGQFLPLGITRIFVTFNGIFSNFLSFIIPLIILGLVTPAIADVGKGAGKLLLMTAGIAYFSTLFSGFMTFFSCDYVFPQILDASNQLSNIDNPEEHLIKPFFTINMPPAMGVMTALILSFCLGIGLSIIKGNTLQDAFSDFREIITKIISGVIIPFLPLYIFGMFLNMTESGQVYKVVSTFIKIIGFVIILHVLLLVLQYIVAGIITKKNPFKLLKNMLPAYATALGTASSAATIPVTMAQTVKNGVDESVAAFTVPLCATIHLAGSTMKIVAFSMAILIMNSQAVNLGDYAGFIFMLGITMIAAPGVPGGAIMAAIGVLESMLGFDQAMIGLMIATYIAIDSVGTACNVTGDGAISLVINRITKKQRD